MKRKHKALKITLVSVFGLIFVLLTVFFIYVSIYNHALDDTDPYLKSDEEISVTLEDDIYTFSSKTKESDSGFIFYPGAKVEYKAYSPVLYKLTKETGITCYLPHMPFNLAFFSSNKADSILKKHSETISWYLGGHSLGGAMACNYLKDNGEKFKGVILEGSYSVYDLKGYTNLSSLLLTASFDKVLNQEKYEDGKANLNNPKEVIIQGGIHSYFGNYGIQSGDGTPTITKEEQWDLTVAAIAEFIK